MTFTQYPPKAVGVVSKNAYYTAMPITTSSMPLEECVDEGCVYILEVQITLYNIYLIVVFNHSIRAWMFGSSQKNFIAQYKWILILLPVIVILLG